MWNCFKKTLFLCLQKITCDFSENKNNSVSIKSVYLWTKFHSVFDRAIDSASLRLYRPCRDSSSSPTEPCMCSCMPIALTDWNRLSSRKCFLVYFNLRSIKIVQTKICQTRKWVFETKQEVDSIHGGNGLRRRPRTDRNCQSVPT